MSTSNINAFADCLPKVADRISEYPEGYREKRVCPKLTGSPAGKFADSDSGYFAPNADFDRAPGISYRRSLITIEILPDNVLLEIFDVYRIVDVQSLRGRPWRWHKLVHVCRSWRQVVFASPRRLDLLLSCSYGTPVRKLLDCWPPLPLAIQYGGLPGRDPPTPEDEDNIIAALQHPKRIWKIELTLTNILLEKLEPLMREPFPILSHLEISQYNAGGVLPSTFLGGSTPCLRVIHVYDIAFPVLPRLHLSVKTVTSLGLIGIPNDGYFSPETIVTSVSMLIQLEALSILFQSPILHHNRRAPPLKRAVLPALISFGFRGSSEYLEDLVARVDAPLLVHVAIKFFNQLIFEVPRLSSFIGRAKMLKSSSEATIYSSQRGISISLTQPTDVDVHGQSHIGVSCKEFDWQVSSLGQICDHTFPLLRCVEQLEIRTDSFSPSGQNDMDTTQWLELFRPFSGVKVLRMASTLGPTVASVLQLATGEPTSRAFPALRDIQLGGTETFTPVEQFISMYKASTSPRP
jgi:hypothetical protein